MRGFICSGPVLEFKRQWQILEKRPYQQLTVEDLLVIFSDVNSHLVDPKQMPVDPKSEKKKKLEHFDAVACAAFPFLRRLLLLMGP